MEKLEFHALWTEIYVDFYSFAFKEKKTFSAVKKSLQQMSLSLPLLFQGVLRVNYPGHGYKFEILGTAEGSFGFPFSCPLHTLRGYMCVNFHFNKNWRGQVLGLRFSCLLNKLGMKTNTLLQP